MNPRARHWTALSVLGALTVTTGCSFVLFKASVLVQAPLALGESTWFIAAHNLVPRFVVGVLLLMAIFGVKVLQLTRTEKIQAAFMAVMSFAGCLAQTDGLQFSTAATTAFLTQFYVILIPVWWAFVHRRLPGAMVFFSGALVLAGVAILARIDWNAFRVGRGEAEVLMAAVFFSVLLCSVNWPGFARNRPERAVAGMFLLESLMFCAVSVVTCRTPANLMMPYFSPNWIALAVVASLLGTAGPYILINHWQRYVTTAEAGVVYSVAPVIAAFTEIFAPGYLSRWLGIDYADQPLTSALLIGGALILAANILIQLRPPAPA